MFIIVDSPVPIYTDCDITSKQQYSYMIIINSDVGWSENKEV